MAQSVMTRIIDGTFAGYGLKLAPDSEMPANRRLAGEIDLAKRVSRVRQVRHAAIPVGDGDGRDGRVRVTCSSRRAETFSLVDDMRRAPTVTA
jgi:hypothetical protein